MNLVALSGPSLSRRTTSVTKRRARERDFEDFAAGDGIIEAEFYEMSDRNIDPNLLPYGRPHAFAFKAQYVDYYA